VINFWAWIYRLTGWYSPFARLAEYKHLKSRFSKIDKQYNDPENDMSFDDLVGLEIGLWQANNGFHRRFKTSKELRKRYKK